VFYPLYYFGCAVLPPLAGALYDRAGGQAALWMATGAALAASLARGLFRRALGATPRAAGAVDRTA